MPAKILVRYAEIALKGKNRHLFERQLQNNLKEAVKDYQASVEKIQGRFLVSGKEEYRGKIIDRISKVFGVASLSAVEETGLDLESIKELAGDMASRLPGDKKEFRVETRRANKQFPYPSPDINRVVGAYLLENYPHFSVNLDKPSFTLSIEISYNQAFLYLDRVEGPGGLPVGITGKALLLLSGGIDSPLAGWLGMKRGLTIEALHFHSYPFTNQRSQEKAVDVCRKLAAGSGSILLHMINVVDIQKELRARCPEDLAIILLRRMMLRLAEKLSESRGLQALITGESLGQVASQTLESLIVTEKATSMLILRPLLGMDKKDIVSKTYEIETYDISIRPYEDCCTLFLPQSPVTRPKLESVENQEKKLDLKELLDRAMDTLETTLVER